MVIIKLASMLRRIANRLSPGHIYIVLGASSRFVLRSSEFGTITVDRVDGGSH